MNNFAVKTFCVSSDYLKDFRKTTWIFILFLVSLILLNYYCIWIVVTSPVKQIQIDNALSTFSVFNPFRTQEDYIFFLSFCILPIFLTTIGIFWLRAKKLKYISTKTIEATTENFVQKFEGKITQNLLWSQVNKVALYRKDIKEILYIKMYEINNEELIVYGMYPWNELINYTQKICESRNIEQVTYNARLGSKEYLLGSPDFSIMLTMPVLVIANQLKYVGLPLPTYIVVASYIILTFTHTAFFTQPLDSNRSKYKYWSFSLMILGLVILTWLIKFKF